MAEHKLSASRIQQHVYFILRYITDLQQTKAIRVNTKQFNMFTEDRRFENKEMIQSSIFAADVSKLWSW